MSTQYFISIGKYIGFMFDNSIGSFGQINTWELGIQTLTNNKVSLKEGYHKGVVK